MKVKFPAVREKKKEGMQNQKKKKKPSKVGMQMQTNEEELKYILFWKSLALCSWEKVSSDVLCTLHCRINGSGEALKKNALFKSLPTDEKGNKRRVS